MSYVINLLEALIVSYGLVELCKIDKKKIFFILNTVITFLITNFFDCIDHNFIPLSLVCICAWYLEVMIFSRKQLVYNIFAVVYIDLFCSICAILPIIFIYNYSVVLAGLTAKLIQFVMTYLFVKYKKKYADFRNKYWITIFLILILGEFIILLQDQQIIMRVYSISGFLTDIFTIIIMGISLYFFHLIEESNLEKERITKLYEKQKYQD